MSPATSSRLVERAQAALDARLTGWPPLEELLVADDGGLPAVTEGWPVDVLEEPSARHFPRLTYEHVTTSRMLREVRWQLDEWAWTVDDRRDVHREVGRALGEGSLWRWRGHQMGVSDMDVRGIGPRDDRPLRRTRRFTIRVT